MKHDAAGESCYKSPGQQGIVRAWCTARLAQWGVPHTEQVVETSAGETHLLRAGFDDAGFDASHTPTVVVVPGTNANGATSLILTEALASRWPTIVLDPPGQPGLSAGERPRKNRLAWYGRWLADALDALSAERVIVLGYSLGGAIALACGSPRIRGRVLISTAGLSTLAVGAGMIGATLPWMLRPTPASSSALLRRFLAPGHAPSTELIEWYTLVAQHTRTSLAPPKLPSSLLRERQSVPRVVATGEYDAFLSPRRLSRPATELLDTTLRVIPNAGHLAVDEHPEAILPFVDEAWRAAGD